MSSTHRVRTVTALAGLLTGLVLVGLLALVAPPVTALANSASGAGPPVGSTPAAPFSWPLAPPHPVLREFQEPVSQWGPGHRGVDLGGVPGERVYATADGVVVFAGHLVDRGVVSIDHDVGGGRLRTTYEPIAPNVTAGQRVRAGELIGRLRPGHPECAGAPACLHWGVRRGEEYLDPLALVSSPHVRLLPW